MHSDSGFEDRLSLALRRYADEVVQPFDADEIVERAVGTPRRPQRFSVFGPSLAPLTLIVTLLLLLALTIATVVLTAPEELRPVRHEPSDFPLGFISAGERGVAVIDETGSHILESDEYYERIAWALSDQRAGLIFQHKVTPEPWPQGAVMWLRAGATEPEVLLPNSVWPVGVTTAGEAASLFVFAVPGADQGCAERLMVLDLDLASGRGTREIARVPGTICLGWSGWAAVGGESVVIMDISETSCPVATLIGASDGAPVQTAVTCLPEVLGSGTALGLDGRTMAFWDYETARLVLIDLVSGATIDDRTVPVPADRWPGLDRPLANLGGWTILVQRNGRIHLFDLEGAEIMSFAAPDAAVGEAVPYYGPLSLAVGTRLGSGSDVLPCQPSDGELPAQELPEPVAATRQLLFDLAASCDYRGLAGIARQHKTGLSIEGAWNSRADEAFATDAYLATAWVGHAATQPEPLGLLAELIADEPVYVDQATDLTSTPGDMREADVWVWPATAVGTDDQMLVISDDGSWRYFGAALWD